MLFIKGAVVGFFLSSWFISQNYVLNLPLAAMTIEVILCILLAGIIGALVGGVVATMIYGPGREAVSRRRGTKSHRYDPGPSV